MAVAAGWLISGIGIFFLASTFRILSEVCPDATTGKIAASPLKITGSKRSYAVITNCTYDGLCYNAKKWKDIW